MTGARAPRVPQPTSARPRAHHLSGWRARAPGQRTPRPASQGSLVRAGPKGRAQESFTGGWALRRRCRCFRSPARSARAPGPCPEPRRPPPSWLEAEAPGRRGAAGTSGASGRWRERGAPLRGGVFREGRLTQQHQEAFRMKPQRSCQRWAWKQGGPWPLRWWRGRQPRFRCNLKEEDAQSAAHVLPEADHYVICSE